VLTLMLTVCALSAQARGPVMLVDDAPSRLQDAAFFVDDSGALDIDDVLAVDPARFVPMTAEEPAWGLQRKTIWVRFAVDRVFVTDAAARSWSLLAGFPRPHEITIYSVDADGAVVATARSGLMIPRSARAAPDDDEIVLPVQPIEGRHYLRVVAEPARLNLWLGADSAFAAVRAKSSLWSGLYYGIFVGLFFFNLLFGLSIKDPAHLLYCAFLLCMGMQIAVRDGWLPDDMPTALFRGTGLSITSLSSLAFTRRFLDVNAKTAPRLSRLFTVGFAAAAITAVPPFFGVMGATASMLVSLGNTFLIAGAAISRALRGDRSAQLFSLAWGVLLSTSALAMLHAMGVIRMPWVASDGVRVGAAVEMILLALALASRVGALRAAKERAERELRDAAQAHSDSMQRSLLEAQELERARFARDLHDGLGHTLLLARQRAETGSELEALLGGAIDDVRGIARALMPARLERAGLEDALRGLADDVVAAAAAASDDDGDSAFVDPDVSVDVNVVVDQGASALAAGLGAAAIHVFRIVQEALSNAIRHGKASTITITLATAGTDVLVVTVDDDGVGIADDGPGIADNSTDNSNHGGGSGLRSMRERARLLGGSVDVGRRRAPLPGTVVTLRLPTIT